MASVEVEVFGPCRVTGTVHTHYALVSGSEKRTRAPVHARRLVRYHALKSLDAGAAQFQQTKLERYLLFQSKNGGS